MLTIWGRADSANVQAVTWTAGELGVPFERHDRGHRFGGTDTPEFRAMNPNGLVPVVRDGDGAPIFESGAIVRYLGERYGSETFWPKDPARRAQIDKWAEWSKVTLWAGFSLPIFVALVRTPADKRDHAAIARAVEALHAKLDIAERQLAANRFIAGDDFTLADIVFGHLLYRYFDIDIARPEQPALAAYYAALTARPAYREHVMVSYDALRAK